MRLRIFRVLLKDQPVYLYLISKPQFNEIFFVHIKAGFYFFRCDLGQLSHNNPVLRRCIVDVGQQIAMPSFRSSFTPSLMVTV